MDEDRKFYVYVMFRINGIPVYVGKGSGRRWKNTWRSHNPHLYALIKENGGPLPTVVIRSDLTEQEALDTECAFISALGREANGGVLCNLTDGGDGKSGYIPSLETRQKIAQSNRGKSASSGTRAKMSAAHKGKVQTAEHVAARMKSRKPLSESAKENIAGARKSPEWRAKMREIALARHACMTPEEKAKRAANISQKTREAMNTEGVKEKLRQVAFYAAPTRERNRKGQFA